jgi:hypothetical protein
MNITDLNLGIAAEQNIVLLQSVRAAVADDTDGTILKLRARLASYPTGDTLADNVQMAMLTMIDSEISNANGALAAI